MAFAVLSPASSSCPFQERHLSPDEPVKIGCAVEGVVISDTNGIFDCKTLSPDHAAMWYTYGKFLMKNCCRTYVNSVQLDKGEIYEMMSGDTLQFGEQDPVFVRGACIIANVKLYRQSHEIEGKCCYKIVNTMGVSFPIFESFNPLPW